MTCQLCFDYRKVSYQVASYWVQPSPRFAKLYKAVPLEVGVSIFQYRDYF